MRMKMRMKMRMRMRMRERDSLASHTSVGSVEAKDRADEKDERAAQEEARDFERRIGRREGVEAGTLYMVR